MKKIKIVTIDDSTFIRKALRRIIESDPDLELVGEASNGEQGLKIVKETRPDVVTLDYKMPGMDGLKVLEEILKFRKIPVIMISSFTREGGEITLKALERGAVDFIDKTSVESPIEFVRLAGEIKSKIKAAASAKVRSLVSEEREKRKVIKKEAPSVDESHYKFEKIIIIGASTGGPQALQYLIPSLPFGYPYPIVIIQHIPRYFSRSLAERLNSFSKLHVVETSDGMVLLKGRVYVAQSGVHLLFGRKDSRYYIIHSQYPEDTFHKPSIDVTFRSAVKIFGKKSVGILLTGMGKDGAEGLREIREAGGITVAESSETAIIYGMPKVAVEIDAAEKVLPLYEIKEFLLHLPDEHKRTSDQ